MLVFDSISLYIFKFVYIFVAVKKHWIEADVTQKLKRNNYKNRMHYTNTLQYPKAINPAYTPNHC